MEGKATGNPRERLRIAVVARTFSTFVQQDVHLLGAFGPVRGVQWRGKRSLFEVVKAVACHDVIVSWFAADHAWVIDHLARWMRKRHIIVVGGGDVEWIPELSYGWLGDSRRRRRTRNLLKRAEAYVVSEHTGRRVQDLAGRDLAVFPNAVDESVFKPAQKEARVVTVAPTTRERVRLKGVDRFVEVARLLPDLRFEVIGPCDPKVRASLRPPENVTWTGPLDVRGVSDRLARAACYCQLSRVESFGVAVVEAAMAGCFPIVSDGGALPETVGKLGLGAVCHDIDECANLIQGVVSVAQDAEGIRKRAIRNFGIARRRAGWRTLLAP